jgi:DNA-binding CsgD family transcriptional regulator
VLQLVAAGLGNARIGEQLGISTSTVKYHLGAVFAKLGVHSRAEAVATGMRGGIVLL